MRILPAILVLALACEQGSAPAAQAAPAAGAPAAPASGDAGEPPDDAVVATWDGGRVTMGDVREEANIQLIRLEAEYLTNRHQVESNALDNVLIGRLLDEEAKAKGYPDKNALLAAEIEAKTPEPTEDEIQAFYQQVRRQLRGRSLEEVRDDLVQELKRRKQSQMFADYIAELEKRKGVKRDLPAPDLPRIPVSVDDDPARGPEDAPVTIIQFADYQCPYCGRAQDTVHKVLQTYGDKVRFVYRDFPLSFHDRAVAAAVAANCAEPQGKYWEMNEAIMAKQSALQEDDLVGYAKQVGLDLDKWNACRKDPAVVAEILKDQDDGSEAGVDGTPAFFINGILLSGAQPFSAFQEIIDRELARAGK